MGRDLFRKPTIQLVRPGSFSEFLQLKVNECNYSSPGRVKVPVTCPVQGGARNMVLGSGRAGVVSLIVNGLKYLHNQHGQDDGYRFKSRYPFFVLM